MYLHNTTALDFLAALSTKESQQVKHLWISIFGISDDCDYPNLSAALSNFKHLQSLHLILPFTQLDTKLMFTKCNQITNLSVLNESVISNNVRITYEHIRRHCLNLKSLQIYQYKNLFSLKDWAFIVNIFPNVIIKSIQIDLHGKCCSMNIITKAWLQSLTAYDF